MSNKIASFSTLRLFISLAFCLPLAIILSSPSLSLADAQLATKIQKRYDAIQSMTAKFEQVLFHKESGSKEKRTGIIEFKKPLLVRWETFNPAPELLLVSAKEIWNHFPDEEVAYKYSLDLVKDPKSIVRVITGMARLDQDFEIKDEGVEDGLVKLHLYPNEPVQAFTEGIIWVDKESSTIRRFKIFDFYANENDILFTEQKMDTKINDNKFIFSSPKDTQIEDRTNSGATRKPLLN